MPTELEARHAAATTRFSLPAEATWEQILLRQHATFLNVGYPINTIEDLFLVSWARMLGIESVDLVSIARAALDTGAHECHYLSEAVLIHRCDGLGMMSPLFQQNEELSTVIERWKEQYQAWKQRLSQAQSPLRKAA